jgi:glycerophosphoryl diester phosphodiesterase
MIAVYIVAALILIFALYILLLSPGRLPQSAPPALWRARYAHRGLHDKENTLPENSLAAFRDAVKEGYGIELDINLTTDDQVVVFHDDDLKRMCGVDKRVADCSWEELQGYRLNGTEQRIPLFSEVLSLVDGRVPLIVELKNTTRNAALCAEGAALLDAYGGPYCIESFHPGIVTWFKKHRPEVVRGQLAAGIRQYGKQVWWQKLLLSSMLTNVASRPHFAAFRHEDAHGRLRLKLYRMAGGKLVAWTVRDTDDIAWCERFFDVIIFEYFRP